MTSAGPGGGVLLGIYTAATGSEPMHSLESVVAREGVGLDGDRYATGRGFYSSRPLPDRQVTLIESELLDWLAAEHQIELDGVETRRNLLVRGVRLAEYVGRDLQVGEVLLRVNRINEPCVHWQDLVGKPVLAPTVHRSGVNCLILRGGVLRVGDAVWCPDEV